MSIKVMRPSRGKEMAGRSSGDASRAKTLFKAALLLMLASIVLGFYKGQFGDEDEKIAAVIVVSHGASLYGDQLINHGPLPFLLAGLGYQLGGPFGSLTGLRILPALFALLSVCLLGSTPLLKSPLLRAYGALIWTIFLSMFWNVKTIHMGLYHGLGGLLGAILVIGILLPLYTGDRRFIKLACGGCIIGALLTLSSVTFVPFAFAVQFSILAFFLLSYSRQCQATGITTQPMGSRLYSQSSKLAASIGVLGILAFFALCISGIISLKGLYYGHIYFNQFILSEMASPLNLFLVVFRSQDPLWINLLRATLITSLFVLPIWLQYLRPKLKRPLLYSLATLPASLGIATLSYRVGIGSISFFTGLPYLLPVAVFSILSCLIIAEQIQHAEMLSSIRILIRRCLVFAPAGLLLLFGAYRLSDSEFGRATTESFSSVRHSLADNSLARVSNERSLVSLLITLIEEKRPQRATRLFSWPFNPIFFALHDRPSGYATNWFLWYNELVEKDRNLARYHVCSPGLKLSQHPDIISYSRVVIFGLDSQKYGRCVLDSMGQHYLRLSESIYLRKDHVKLMSELYEKHPQARLLAKILAPLNWPKNKELPADLEPVVLDGNATTSFMIKAERDVEFDMVGLRLPVFNVIHYGEVSLCLKVLPRQEPTCSERVDMSTIRDNDVVRFSLERPVSLAAGDKIKLSLLVKTQDSNGRRSGKNISILVLPILKSPLVFVGK